MTEPAGSLRAFVAIALPEPLRESLVATVAEMRSASWAREVRWVPPGNWHVTLRFLGTLPRDRVDAAVAAVRSAVAPLAPFRARLLAPPVLFPGPRRPRALVVRLEDDPALLGLAAAVAAALVEAKLAAADSRRFAPHLTLGRIRRPLSSPPSLADASVPSDLPVASAVVYRSELRPTGAVYDALAECPLRGGSPSPAVSADAG